MVQWTYMKTAHCKYMQIYTSLGNSETARMKSMIALVSDTISVINTITKCNLGRKEFICLILTDHNPSWMEVRARIWRQVLKQRSWGNSASRMAFQDLLSLFSYTNQDHLLRSGNAHCRWSLTTSIINQKMSFRFAYRSTR